MPNQKCQVIPRKVCQPACNESPQCRRCEQFRERGGFSSCESGVCPNYYPEDSFFNTTYGDGFNPGYDYNAGFNPGDGGSVVIDNEGFNPGFNDDYFGGANEGFNPGYNGNTGGSGYNPGFPDYGGNSGFNPGFPDYGGGVYPDNGNSGFNPGYNNGGNSGFNPGYPDYGNSGFNPGFNSGGSGFNPGYNGGNSGFNPGFNGGNSGFNTEGDFGGEGFNPGGRGDMPPALAPASPFLSESRVKSADNRADAELSS